MHASSEISIALITKITYFDHALLKFETHSADFCEYMVVCEMVDNGIICINF